MKHPLAFHPLANLFPLIEGEEFKALAADIKTNGLREPIVLLGGKILDGRNRYRASRAAKLPLKPKHFTTLAKSIEPLSWVISKNLARRHLNESQRAMVAARIANMRQGERTDLNPSAKLQKVSQSKSADILNVSTRLVADARKVQETAVPAVKAAVDRGHLPVSTAARLAELPSAEQTRIVKASKPEALAGEARTEIKKFDRETKEKNLAERQRALPDKKYGVILADPEWRFEPYSRDSGMDRAADNHYPTSDTLDIIARPVASIAAEDCVLFLWATAPMLPQALRVMAGWRFDYKTHAIWHKVRVGNGRGTGYWFTGEHELLLVGTRGKIPAPATAICGSLIAAPVGGHSEKPEAVLELIEQTFPNLPKIELNARRARPGWDAWGLEAPEQPSPRAETLDRMYGASDDGQLEIPPGLRRQMPSEAAE